MVEERWNFVKKNSICFLCLEKFHPGSPCAIYRTCNFDKCNMRHHSLLHVVVFLSETERKSGTSNSIAGCSIIKPLSSYEVESANIMPSAVAYITNGSKSQKIRIAFDTMCQDTFIAEDVTKRLNLKFYKDVELDVM